MTHLTGEQMPDRSQGSAEGPQPRRAFDQRVPPQVCADDGAPTPRFGSDITEQGDDTGSSSAVSERYVIAHRVDQPRDRPAATQQCVKRIDPPEEQRAVAADREAVSTVVLAGATSGRGPSEYQRPRNSSVSLARFTAQRSQAGPTSRSGRPAWRAGTSNAAPQASAAAANGVSGDSNHSDRPSTVASSRCRPRRCERRSGPTSMA